MSRASRTARLAALARASQTREPEPLRGPDTFAHGFIGPIYRFIVGVEPLRRIVTRIIARTMPGAYGLVLARSRQVDACVERELAAGATQLVILGAGYDTRVHRFAHLLQGRGRAFEVDEPATSDSKQTHVRKIFGALPKHVAYVKVDFDRQSMEEPLLAAGYDPSARTVFTWEGVTFYITPEAVDRTFAFVAQKAGKGSTIAFDYLFRTILEGPTTPFGAGQTILSVAKKGEPFTFGLDQSKLSEFLAARGLRLEENLLPDELQRRYVPAPDDPTYRVGGFYGVATARVS